MAEILARHPAASETVLFPAARLPQARNMTISDDVLDQTRQCLRNIDHALAQAGATRAHIVRVNYIVPNPQDFEPCWPTLREYFAAVLPAATMFSAGLADPRMKIEIEVTAKK